MLLAAGIGLCLTAFIVYSRFLGWIDGLPSLPEKYLVVATSDHPPLEPQLESRTDRVLRLAFGEKCAELNYVYKFEMQIQGIYIAFAEFNIEPDGRVKLSPMSLAVMGKVNPKTKFPEINTVHCDVAHITFDRKIEVVSDIFRSRLVYAEFASDPALSTDPRHGKIVVVSNHATPDPKDHLIATMPGPLFFRDNAAQEPTKPQLWTNKSIEITDYQTRPPHVVKASTLNVFLEPDALRPDKAPRAKSPSAGPVKRVEMRNVWMILTIDGKSDFLRSPAEAAATPPKPGDHSILSIRTLGPFNLDLRNNKASFEIDRQLNKRLRQYVEIDRDSKAGTDELRCERLDLSFRRRPTAGQTGLEQSSSMEITEALATGETVKLDSPAEKLRATGTELIFRNEQRQAVLKGAPMVAIKEDNRIEAAELVLNRPDPSAPPRAGQPVQLGRAAGPGTVYLNDLKENRSATVRWNDVLSIDRDGDRDRITLTGGATFDDQQNQQWLQGNEIQLWLTKGAVDALSRPGPGATRRARPEKMRVIGQVKARTPELSIHDTDLIVVRFQDAPPAATRLAIAQPTSNNGPPRPALFPPNPTNANRAPKIPLELSAETIETFVFRNGEQMTLDRVSCRRRVHVHQQAEKPSERGLDVIGDTLDLTHSNDGDVLKITGAAKKPAKIEVREMTLHGPQVVCDQRDNHVEVDGAGNVRLLASTNLNGDKLERPSEIVIWWNGHMNLAGNRIEFDGGVQAEQESARIKDRERIREQNRLLCPKMDVFLDRSISLSPIHRQHMTQAGLNAPDAENPRIKRVICHRGNGRHALQSVMIASTTWTNGKMSQYHRIEAPEVTFDNDAGEVSTAGPGEVRLFQLGDDTTFDPKKKERRDQDKPPAQVFKLTCIKFDGRMRGQNRTRMASFIGPVQVAHAPSNDPNLTINPDKLPPGAFTLSCQKLNVGSEEKNGRRTATMLAEGKADIFAADFSGRADLIKYDEAKKQQIIFEANDDSNLAVLYHIKVKGGPQRTLRGKTIIYFRETNEFRGVGIYEVSGSE